MCLSVSSYCSELLWTLVQVLLKCQGAEFPSFLEVPELSSVCTVGQELNVSNLRLMAWSADSEQGRETVT